MYYLLIFMLILFIINKRTSTSVNKKAQRWLTFFLILCGVLSIGIVVYTFFSINQ